MNSQSYVLMVEKQARIYQHDQNQYEANVWCTFLMLNFFCFGIITIVVVRLFELRTILHGLLMLRGKLNQVSINIKESISFIPRIFLELKPSPYLTPIFLPIILAREITDSRKSGVEIYVCGPSSSFPGL